MANWKQSGEKWAKTENGLLIVVTHTRFGDYSAEYRSYRGGLYQLGYYPTKDEAQKACEDKAYDRPVKPGKRRA